MKPFLPGGNGLCEVTVPDLALSRTLPTFLINRSASSSSKTPDVRRLKKPGGAHAEQGVSLGKDLVR